MQAASLHYLTPGNLARCQKALEDLSDGILLHDLSIPPTQWEALGTAITVLRKLREENAHGMEGIN
jgi:hypothetical protein